jgi:hypothetical protein
MAANTRREVRFIGFSRVEYMGREYKLRPIRQRRGMKRKTTGFHPVLR